MSSTTITNAAIGKTRRKSVGVAVVGGGHMKHHMLKDGVGSSMSSIKRDAMMALLPKHGIDPARTDVVEWLNQFSEAGTDDISFGDIVMNIGDGSVCSKLLTGTLAVPKWGDFCEKVVDLCHDIVEDVQGGTNATYIPILAESDPETFAVSVCTVDGQQFSYGDFHTEFSIQSCVKPLIYAVAVEENGVKSVHQHVGIEPSGLAFNEVDLNDKNLPHNPMINSGAIATGSLIRRDLDASSRFRHFLMQLEALAGGCKIGFSQPTYLCEMETAYRNRALMYYMQDENVFPPNTTVESALNFYIQCCSIEIQTQAAANIACTLANGGVSPLSQQKVLSPLTVKSTLTLMFSCGMYDYSGEWGVLVGVPAKSGVAGLIYVVVPHVMGIAVLSPPLDSRGNSFRGVEFCKRFLDQFNFGIFEHLVADKKGEAAGRVPRSITPARDSAQGLPLPLQRLKNAAVVPDSPSGSDTDDGSTIGRRGRTGWRVTGNKELSPPSKAVGGIVVSQLVLPASDEKDEKRASQTEGVSRFVASFQHKFWSKLDSWLYVFGRLGDLAVAFVELKVNGHLGHGAPKLPHSKSVVGSRSSTAGGSSSSTAFRRRRSLVGSNALHLDEAEEEEDEADDPPLLKVTKKQKKKKLTLSERVGEPLREATVTREVIVDMLTTAGVQVNEVSNPKALALVNAMTNENGEISLLSIMRNCTRQSNVVVKAMLEDLAIPDFASFTDNITGMFEQIRDTAVTGTARDAMDSPDDPQKFSLSLCTVDGQEFSVGDVGAPFSLGSTVQPLLYALAVKEFGEEAVHELVGREPTSRDPNGFDLQRGDDGRLRPFNPFMDSGALTILSMISSKFKDTASRFRYINDILTEWTGGRRLGFRQPGFLHLQEHQLQAQAVSQYVKGMGCMPDSAHPSDIAKMMFQCNSIETRTSELAVLAAMLANIGEAPTTGTECLGAVELQSLLSLMFCCGMNEYTGQWAFNVGIPAKASPNGVLMVVIPNVMGMALYSPPVNKYNVSTRGIELFQLLVSRYRVNLFDQLVYQDAEIGIENVAVEETYEHKALSVMFLDLCMACMEGDADRVYMVAGWF